MKSNKTIRLILIILICILIILIGFLGVYTKKDIGYKNLLSDCALASDLKGATVLEFEVSTENKTKYYDKDGNLVDESTITDENKNDYNKEEVPVNDESQLTKENYNKVIEIMKQRLNFLKTDQYRIDLNSKTGKIVLTFEDDYPDDVKSILPMEGRLELVDSNSSNIIINNNDFKLVEATYASTEEGYTTYLSIKLNSDGVQKINAIKNNLTANKLEEKKEMDEETNTEDDNSIETQERKFKIMFDDEKIEELSYDAMILVGKTLRITTAENLTSSSTVQSKMNTNSVIAKLANIGKMPVIYENSAEEYAKNDLIDNINYLIYGIAILCILISIYLVFKYKVNGILATLTFATNVSLFLIIIRLTQIPISLNGFASFIILIILNTMLVNNILKNIQNESNSFSENIKRAYLNTMNAFIIVLITFAVFAFAKMTLVNSIGLLLFWGWIVVVIGNLALTIPILSINNRRN